MAARTMPPVAATSLCRFASASLCTSSGVRSGAKSSHRSTPAGEEGGRLPAAETRHPQGISGGLTLSLDPFCVVLVQWHPQGRRAVQRGAGKVDPLRRLGDLGAGEVLGSSEDLLGWKSPSGLWGKGRDRFGATGEPGRVRPRGAPPTRDLAQGQLLRPADDGGGW